MVSTDSLPLATRLERLRRLHPRLRVEALISAIPAAARDELAALGVELIELASVPDSSPKSALRTRAERAWLAVRGGHPDDIRARALVGVAAVFGDLEPEARAAALAAGAGRWSSALERIPLPESPRAKVSLARLAAESLDPSVLEHVRPFLSEPDGPAASAADRAFALVGYALGVALAPRAFESLVAQPESAPTPRELDADRAFPEFAAGRWSEPDARSSLALERVVASAAADFGVHQRRGPIMGAMLLANSERVRAPGSPIAAWLRDARQPGHAALRGVMRWSTLPASRERAWEWLAHGHFEIAAIDRLSRGRTTDEHESLLSRGHLSLRPARAARLEKVAIPSARSTAAPRVGDAEKPRGQAKDPRASTSAGATSTHVEASLPARAEFAQLSTHAKRWLPRVASLMKGDGPGRIRACEALLADDSALVRYALVRSGPVRLLEDLAFDADPRVARSAMLAWSEGGMLSHAARLPEPDADRGAMAQRLTKSANETIRAWAEDDVALVPSLAFAPASPQRFTSNSVGVRLRWRRALDSDPAATIDRLRVLLREGSSEERVNAVLLARALNVSQKLWEDLVGIASGAAWNAKAVAPDSRLIATAVSALADVVGPAPESSILACTRSEDARVRANAADALARRTRRGLMPKPPLASLIELKTDPHHRVRASAIGTLLHELADAQNAADAPRAIDDLASMLKDERPSHRVAALWASERVMPGPGHRVIGPRWAEMLARIVEVAKFDDDEGVRRRALRCAARLERDIRGRRLAGSAP